ncbi:MAG: hypothetical protein ACFBZ8_06565 [Opitutales bacterium]
MEKAAAAQQREMEKGNKFMAEVVGLSFVESTEFSATIWRNRDAGKLRFKCPCPGFAMAPCKQKTGDLPAEALRL